MQTWPDYMPDLGPCQFGRTLVVTDGPTTGACPRAAEELLVVLNDEEPAEMPMNVPLCPEHMAHVENLGGVGRQPGTGD